MEITQKAAAIADACGEFLLVSVTENGYPRICVLSKIKNEGIKKVWCATGLQGVKTQNFLANDKASACFWKDGDSITLLGNVQVKTDKQTREVMWVDWFINHFPGGVEDPGYCVLEFTTSEATLWIDGEFITVAADAL